MGGIGSGVQNVLGGAGDFAGQYGSIGAGVQNVLGGAGKLVGGVGSGVQNVLGGAGRLVGGVGSGVNDVLGGAGNGVGSMLNGNNDYYEEKGCSLQPNMQQGCDPIGYNSPNCDEANSSCQCEGVSVWKNELNAQGFNSPLGYSQNNVGSSF